MTSISAFFQRTTLRMKSKKIQLKKIVCISVSVFYPITFFAQEPVLDSVQQPDSLTISVQSPITEYFSEEDSFSAPASSFHSIDTSLNNIQKYFPNNFPYGLGLVNRKLSYAVSPEIGFQSGLPNRDWFGYNRKETKYYRTRTPYTEVFALFGMKKEQLARLLHTQNITRQWNIAFNMLRLRSEGFYNRQSCTDNNISLSSNYTSKNNHYSLLANGSISSVKTDENGGIGSEDAFENNLFENKKLLSVNLTSARTRRGNREFTVSQFLHFGKKDTTNTEINSAQVNDSVLRYKIIPKSFLAYSFHAGDNWFVYEDGNPAAGFYQNIFYDSTKTLDSVFIQSIENSIAWGYRGFCVSIKNELSRIQERQNNSAIPVLMDSTLNNSFASVSFEKSFILWKANYCFYGQNKNDLLLYVEGRLSPTKHSRLSIITKVSETVPSFISQRYSSNHFYWMNDYEKTFFAGGEVKYSDEKYKFSVHGSLSEIENYIFWISESSIILMDSTNFPIAFFSAQSDAMIYSVCAEKKIHISKFHFNNKITWQQGTEDVIHLPQFVTEHSLYYESRWFKKAVDVQLGFDVTYFSFYYADAYMPALGLYYLQDKKKIGNYPYIDFFFSMKIKRARIFFKTEHINSGFTGAYYLAPNYPAPDRSFKVGIKWVFFD